MIDLSIIIPHYNTPLYLKTLLESIPALKNIQVIVVDDKSDVDIETYNDLKNSADFSHVIFLDNTTVIKSAGTCRNIGLQRAEGKWILFADADDFFVEGFYPIVEKYFENNSDVVFFIPTSVDRDTMQPAIRHVLFKEWVMNYCNSQTVRSELFLRFKLAAPWSKLIKHELIKKFKIEFDETPVSNDLAFSTKIGYYLKSFDVCKETIYCTTNNSGSLTKRLTEANYDSRMSVFIWRYHFLKEHLSKDEFKAFDLSGIIQILSAWKYGLGLKKTLKMFLLFRKNKIRLVSSRFYNPFFLIRRIKHMHIINKKNRRFFVKE